MSTPDDTTTTPKGPVLVPPVSTTTTTTKNLLYGRYDVIRKIGEGGMGTVHLAHDVWIHREVALKRMHHTTRSFTERFHREYHALAAIEHTGVPGIFDAGVSEKGEAYFTMEIVKGETLLEHLKRGPISPLRALSIAIDLGRVLMAVHAVGVIHRDVKPNNLILEVGDHVRLLDFGICYLTSDYYRQPHLRVLTPESDRWETGDYEIVGNAAYTDPQHFSEGLTAPANDVFSVCVVLYEMITGRTLYDERTRRHREIRAEEFLPELAPLVAELQRGVALAHERHTSMADLVRALEIVRASLTTTRQAVAAAPTPAASAGPGGLRRAGAGFATMSAAFVAGGTVGLLLARAMAAPASSPEIEAPSAIVGRDAAPSAPPNSRAATSAARVDVLAAPSPSTWDARMAEVEASARRCLDAAGLLPRRVIVTLAPGEPTGFTNVTADSPHARCIRDALDRLQIRSDIRRRHIFFDTP